jgi:hypothetical protein
MALSNIDNVKVKLKGIELLQTQDSENGIKTKLIEHYKINLTDQILRLIGSLNIIGNPGKKKNKEKKEI